jgi:hypothetical protein
MLPMKIQALIEKQNAKSSKLTDLRTKNQNFSHFENHRHFEKLS